MKGLGHIAPLIGLSDAYLTSKNHVRQCRSIVWAQKEATFGMGCFWKPSEELLKVPGVIATVVGYTGNPNETKPPKYDEVCFSRDWVEGVRVYYDDEQISYSQLLDAFFLAQEPNLGSRQYASIMFPHHDEQKEAASKWLAENQQRVRGDGVFGGMTRVEPLSPFYRAEEYHQQYWQKLRPRISAMIGLLAVASGVVDGVVPQGTQSLLHSGANAIVLAGCAYVLGERFFDTKTVQL